MLSLLLVGHRIQPSQLRVLLVPPSYFDRFDWVLVVGVVVLV